MLTVLSADSTPESMLVPIWLAADWASQDREVLIVEANSQSGTVSETLGIPVTPGAASLIASGLPTRGAHLIEHSLDVLFEKLHVMPSPTSPAGAQRVVAALEERAAELREVSDKELAVMVIGGALTSGSTSRSLLKNSAGFVLVATPQTDMLEVDNMLRDFASARYGTEPKGFCVTLGPSQFSEAEWLSRCGLVFSGMIENTAVIAQDFSVFTGRRKRRARKFINSLETVGEVLYPYAYPPITAERERLAEQEALAELALKSRRARSEPDQSDRQTDSSAQSTGSFREWAAVLHDSP